MSGGTSGDTAGPGSSPPAWGRASCGGTKGPVHGAALEAAQNGRRELRVHAGISVPAPSGRLSAGGNGNPEATARSGTRKAPRDLSGCSCPANTSPRRAASAPRTTAGTMRGLSTASKSWLGLLQLPQPLRSSPMPMPAINLLLLIPGGPGPSLAARPGPAPSPRAPLAPRRFPASHFPGCLASVCAFQTPANLSVVTTPIN